jgi:hypothetical protein
MVGGQIRTNRPAHVSRNANIAAGRTHREETVSAYAGAMGNELLGKYRLKSNFGFRTVVDMIRVEPQLRWFLAKQ